MVSVVVLIACKKGGCDVGLSVSTEHQDYLMLFRKHVSRKAAGRGRALLEGLGLDTPTIDACFASHPLREEEAVQDGLTKWSEGQSTKQPTWEVLLVAMEYAQIARQYVMELKKDLGL